MDQTQIDYVKGELDRGVAPDTLRQALRDANYSDETIEQLFTAAQTGQVPAMPVQPVADTGMPTWAWVVIGIFGFVFIFGGLLSFVVMASLNDAQDSARDAYSMTVLNNIRNVAEIYWSENESTYAGLCSSPDAAGLLGATGGVGCADSAEAYRAHVELIKEGYYCVDNTGYADRQATEPTGLSCS